MTDREKELEALLADALCHLSEDSFLKSRIWILAGYCGEKIGRAYNESCEKNRELRHKIIETLRDKK